MSTLLEVFRPPHPETGEEVTENLSLLTSDNAKNSDELNFVSPAQTEERPQIARISPDCEIKYDINWIDSTQTTLHTVNGSQVLSSKMAERIRQQAVFEDANHNEAYDTRYGRTFNVNRIYSDAYLPEKRLMIRDGTPLSTAPVNSIPPALQRRWKRRGDDAFLAMISALYAKILVIMGLAFPMTEVISPTVRPTSTTFLAFYLYLYFGSIVYFLYVFIALLWNKARCGRSFLCCRKEDTNLDEVKKSREDGHHYKMRPRVLSDLRTPHHHGSFYLRIGAVAFGVGSMIYSGLEFAQYFEFDAKSQCHNILMAINPAARMVFTFIQMYFIFLNAKMTIYENKAIAYFGLMHMLATNMCVWLNVIIEETKHDNFAHHNDAVDNFVKRGSSHSPLPSLHKGQSLATTIATTINSTLEATIAAASEAIMSAVHEAKTSSNVHQLVTSTVAALENATLVSEMSTLFETTTESNAGDPIALGLIDTHAFDAHVPQGDECQRKKIMGGLVQNASPFLFPCAIEYSLICAAILYLMWKNVGTRDAPSPRGSTTSSFPARRSRHHYSVDCARANKGLFLGIFVLVLTIISLLMFFTLNDKADYQHVAQTEVNVARLVLFCMAFIAVVIGMIQVRELRFESSRRLGLDDVLLVFGQSGVISYNVFTIIAAFYFKGDSGYGSMLVLLSALAALLQAIAQTLFILDASRRNTYSADQQRRKPGREVVTFLLVANFAMWTFNTLEKSRADRSIHPIPLNFYGLWPWIIITNVSMPLAIFYRFHSTVVLCEIWKRCYKVKPEYP